MEITLIIIGIILGLVGIAGSVLPILPGPPAGYIGLLLVYFSGRTDYSVIFIVVMALITIAVSIIDYIVPMYMTRKSGGSKAAERWSIAGMIAGILFFPPLGIFIGTLIGAFLGEMIGAKSNTSKSVIVALGAFVGFILGTGLKLALCFTLLYYIAKPIFA